MITTPENVGGTEVSEERITCQQRDDLFIACNSNGGGVSVSSSITNYVDGEILDPRLPGHTATTWCDERGRPFLREILDAEGCRHWAIDRPDNVEEPK